MLSPERRRVPPHRPRKPRPGCSARLALRAPRCRATSHLRPSPAAPALPPAQPRCRRPARIRLDAIASKAHSRPFELRSRASHVPCEHLAARTGCGDDQHSRRLIQLRAPAHSLCVCARRRPELQSYRFECTKPAARASLGRWLWLLGCVLLCHEGRLTSPRVVRSLLDATTMQQQLDAAPALIPARSACPFSNPGAAFARSHGLPAAKQQAHRWGRTRRCVRVKGWGRGSGSRTGMTSWVCTRWESVRLRLYGRGVGAASDSHAPEEVLRLTICSAYGRATPAQAQHQPPRARAQPV